MSTYYRMIIDAAGNMHHHKETGGLGWKAIETALDSDFDDFSYIVLVENGKVYVTRELIKIVGKGIIGEGEKVRLEGKRQAFQVTQDDLKNWLFYNDQESRTPRDKEAKDRNLGIINFLSQLLAAKIPL